jgi:hypothetical protein
MPLKTSETLETYACNMRFQQNMAVKRAEHGTAGSRLCGLGGEGWQWAVVRAPAIGRTQCSWWRQQQQSGGAASRGEHAVAVQARWRGRGRPA